MQFCNLVQTVYHSVKCLCENGRIQFDEHQVIGLDPPKVKGGEKRSAFVWMQYVRKLRINAAVVA